MKVFVSWSGEVSHQAALALHDWLPNVLQLLKPYVSSEDIDKGIRWSTDIAGELAASEFGILCITADNMDAPWINFEAGALMKALDKANVAPFLIGLRPAELKGPLLQFQATVVQKDDVWKLIATLNNRCGNAALEEGRLRTAFDHWWPSLEKRLADIRPQIANAPPRRPDVHASIEEILERIRSQEKLLADLYARAGPRPEARAEPAPSPHARVELGPAPLGRKSSFSLRIHQDGDQTYRIAIGDRESVLDRQTLETRLAIVGLGPGTVRNVLHQLAQVTDLTVDFVDHRDLVESRFFDTPALPVADEDSTSHRLRSAPREPRG